MQNYFDNEATSSALHATMKPARGGKCLVTLSTYEDRKEALLNTTILDDAGTCRSKGPKINSLLQARQQNDSTDSKETKQDIYSHIPKPPPLQMTNNNSNTYKANNNNTTQTTTTAKNNTNDHSNSAQRLSNNMQNINGNVFTANDTYSIPNKTPAPTNGFSSNNNQTNRQTLRLGTVTIGEYRQQTLRREPEKFDFISTQKKARDSGDTTPTNEALQSELQNTLSRANLRKSNGNGYTEHQRNCPLLQQSMDCGNNGFTVEEMSKKLQKSSINDNSNRPINSASGTGVGILKNGNRNGTSSSSKSAEKSIKFG